ncbi:hypothetical protein ANN_11852 [Periplaneta americana]|uniref:Uncharacterized protein n=1 Tax=Periplaneta americana TaxID=6978 RepID=A0ABQ8T681_PERAM|nr:hypothetical protein ANN_11852 [Periplaneta americana]
MAGLFLTVADNVRLSQASPLSYAKGCSARVICPYYVTQNRPTLDPKCAHYSLGSHICPVPYSRGLKHHALDQRSSRECTLVLASLTLERSSAFMGADGTGVQPITTQLTAVQPLTSQFCTVIKPQVSIILGYAIERELAKSHGGWKSNTVAEGVPPIRKHHCSNMKAQVSIILGYAIERQLAKRHGGWKSNTVAEGDNAGEMSPGSSAESYPAFAHIGLRENRGKNLNQVTCPDRDSNPGHLVSQPDALTVTPQHCDQLRSIALTLKLGAFPNPHRLITLLAAYPGFEQATSLVSMPATSVRRQPGIGESYERIPNLSAEQSDAITTVKSLDRPAGCWPHAHMPKQRWTIIQPEWKYRVVSTMIPPAIIAGIRNRISPPIVAPQVQHDVVWVSYSGRNFMTKFLPPWGLEPERIP